jgi:hypothetical protein
MAFRISSPSSKTGVNPFFLSFSMTFFAIVVLPEALRPVKKTTAGETLNPVIQSHSSSKA